MIKVRIHENSRVSLGINEIEYLLDGVPSSLTAFAFSNVRIDLVWLSSSTTEQGFSIERSTDGVNYSIIKNVVAGVHSYSDTTGVENTLYYYRVRAFSGAEYSVYTNVASATTIVDEIFESNKIAWFDFSYIATLTKDGSNRISIWRDRKGGVISLLQSGLDSIKPTHTSDGVLFNGTNQYLKAVFTLAQPTMIYIVFKQITYINGRRIFDGAANDSGELAQIGTSPALSVLSGGGFSSANTSLVLNTFGIARILFSGSNSTFQINETAPYTNSGVATMGGFTLGGSGGLGNYSNIKVKDVIIGNAADSLDTQLSIYNYLKTKDMPSSYSWNNIVGNRIIFSTFLSKLNYKTVDVNNQLNIVMVGDSIFGRLATGEISDNNKAAAHFPPGAWQKNVQYKLLDSLQFNRTGVSYYNIMAVEWTRNGTWSYKANIDANEIYTNSVAGSYIQITITGVTFFKIIWCDVVTASTTYSPINVTINGSLPSAIGITGVDSFYCGATFAMALKWNNTIWRGLSSGTSYTFRFTKANNDETVFWGCETWTNPRLNIINEGRGGYVAGNHKSTLNRFNSSSYSPQLIIHELPCLNDTYSVNDKGWKIPSSPGISAVVGDYIYAQVAGTFTNYGGLVLTINELAEYNGSTWVKGSTVVTNMINTYNSNITYLNDVAAMGIPAIILSPHRTARALVPYYQTMLATAMALATSNNMALVNFDYKYVELGLTIATYVSDGTHLNDAGVQLWRETILELF